MDGETLNKRVAQFIAIRSRRRDLKTEYAKKDVPLAEAQNLLSGAIMEHLKATGAAKPSIKTDAGTCFISEKATASLADADAFMRFVKEHQAFDLLDRKANVTAVKDYIKEHEGMAPPGVNYSVFQTVNVRANGSTGDTHHDD